MAGTGTGRRPVPGALLSSAHLALDRLDWSPFDEALADLETISIRSRVHREFILYLRARAALVRGEQQRLLRQFSRRRQYGRNSRSTPGSVLAQYAEADLALSCGDIPRARMAIPRGEATTYLSDLLMARVALAEGHPESAIRRLSASKWLERAPRRGRIDLRLALASALDRAGDSVGGTRVVREALTQTGAPQQIAFSLATTERPTIERAIQQDPAVSAALSWFATTLYVPPFTTESGAPVPLSRREYTVLKLLATGMTAAEIAETLIVSVHTVRNQTQRIYRKLNVSSRDQAIRVAWRHGLLRVGEDGG
ncbi:helix-turn-helix transcriptional regulator [Aeromicrobium phragmitis]|uniref:helix-turn-helix transcriptional regulator n=1 Tax=Aeromicrobium phragmitis TaxID=2478914 RepID=UPI00140BCA7C|nr:LuxR C-terminal-related transcriptional regulator [Aeromicrobium phragmitis]